MLRAAGEPIARPDAMLRRCMALIALVALIGTPVLARWHEAAVRHAYCVRHGEAVEVGGQAHAARNAVLPDAGRVPGGEHEHCTLGASSLAPGALSAPAVHVGAPELLTWVAAPAIEPDARWSQVFRAAPKTSPPV